jgi:ABC-type oligopeptide transport system substrate-binding subunit
MLRRAACLVLVLVAAGCGGATSSREPATTGARVAPATSASAGTLRIAVGSDPSSLDPAFATDAATTLLVDNVYVPIVKLGAAPDLAPEPALAASWTTSGRTVTLHLRTDVLWSDGVPVTANDVVWSWLRAMSPQRHAPLAYEFDGIEGAHAYSSCRPRRANRRCGRLERRVAISAPDATTVRIRLTLPEPWFVQQLSSTAFIPVAQDAPRGVTDGPFTVLRRRRGRSLTLRKNPAYFEAATVKLHTVELAVIRGGSAAEQAFYAGNVDVNATGWPRPDTARIKSQPSYQQFPSLAVYYYGFNVAAIPDPNERKAMALAIDRQSIVQHVTQTGQVPATAFSPQGMPGASTIDGQAFLKPTADMALARQYMAKVADPVREVGLLVNRGPGHLAIAAAVRARWRRLGLTVTLRQRDWRTALKALGPPPEPTVSVYRSGWIADFPDDIDFLRVFRCGSRDNFTNWCSERYDRLLKRAAVTPDQSSRYDLYQQAESLLTGKNGDMPIAPIYWYTFAYQVGQNVHGWNTNPLDEIDLTKVSVS